jgi:hypothetical protein
MSTYWDVKCSDCGSYAGFGFGLNKVPDVALAIIELAPIAVQLHRWSSETDAHAGLEPELRVWIDVSVPLHWFAAHEGHALVAENEYGDEYDPLTD